MARSAWAAAGAPAAVTIDSFATLVELAKLLGLAAVFMVGVIVGGGERRSRAAFHALGLAAGTALGSLRDACGRGNEFTQKLRITHR